MLDRRGLLEDGRLEHADGSTDYANGISSKVIRCRYDGQRAVAVGVDAGAETQIAAVVDLFDLHLHGGGQYRGMGVSADEVTVLLGGRHKGRREAVDAVRTLTTAMRLGPRIRLLEHDADEWAAPSDVPWDISDVGHYASYPGLLAGVADEAPPLVADLVHRVNMPAVRAYPMLTDRGRWSIRLEGLEIGRLSATRGTLDVGKDSRTGSGRQSRERTAWISANGRTPIHVGPDDASLSSAAAAIRAFTEVWPPSTASGAAATPKKQNEHALESRILRGIVPISIGGRELRVLRPNDTVNWGSQFPTKWGRDGSARYLDALLVDGSTPWAIEMKVHGGGGIRQYYRHALVQAVLYREFIRSAKPLHSWFDDRGLDATGCEAAVVIPQVHDASAHRLSRLEALCAVFDVSLVQVPHKYARLNGES